MSRPDAPSPTPSQMPPPPNLKRPRQSATAGGGGRTKRRKPEDSAGPDSGTEKRGGAVNFGVGMVKGREEEYGEPQDIVTKIDFNDLPDLALHRYLELHDLLPRWDVSPWSEKPCTPPNALYTLPAPPPAVPINPHASPKARESSMVGSPQTTSSALPVDDSANPPAPSAPSATENAGQPDLVAKEESIQPADGSASVEPEGGTPAPPTTRSKTLPSRKPPTPSPAPAVIKRGVMTLSDVHAAREALAERANAHWAKGLGGGQNKEGETIVNFLYKNRVGHGRLLRVYNPLKDGISPVVV